MYHHHESRVQVSAKDILEGSNTRIWFHDVNVTANMFGPPYLPQGDIHNSNPAINLSNHLYDQFHHFIQRSILYTNDCCLMPPNWCSLRAKHSTAVSSLFIIWQAYRALEDEDFKGNRDTQYSVFGQLIVDLFTKNASKPLTMAVVNTLAFVITSTPTRITGCDTDAILPRVRLLYELHWIRKSMHDTNKDDEILAYAIETAVQSLQEIILVLAKEAFENIWNALPDNFNIIVKHMPMQNTPKDITPLMSFFNALFDDRVTKDIAQLQMSVHIQIIPQIVNTLLASFFEYLLNNKCRINRQGALALQFELELISRWLHSTLSMKMVLETNNSVVSQYLAICKVLQHPQAFTQHKRSGCLSFSGNARVIPECLLLQQLSMSDIMKWLRVSSNKYSGKFA